MWELLALHVLAGWGAGRGKAACWSPGSHSGQDNVRERQDFSPWPHFGLCSGGLEFEGQQVWLGALPLLVFDTWGGLKAGCPMSCGGGPCRGQEALERHIMLAVPLSGTPCLNQLAARGAR